MPLAIVALGITTAPIAIAAGFVLVEPGSFPRGHERGGYGALVRDGFPLAIDGQFYGDSERPFHYAFITRPFHIAKSEVSVGEFRTFVEKTGYVTEAEQSGEGIVGWAPSEFGEKDKAPQWDMPRHDFEKAPAFTWRDPGFPQSDDHPVVGVSWNDAQAYCRWRSKNDGATYRLPTEAEWEMAARSGQGTRFYPWGDAARNTIHRHANIGNVDLERARPLAAQRHWLLDIETDPGDGHVHTAPTASFQANPWGLHDMAGNVFEWCQDYFNFNFYHHWEPERTLHPVAVDPLNDSEKDSEANAFRVIRGGSWYTGPLAARSSARGFFDQPEASAYIGFRLVREATGIEASNFPNPYESYLENVATLEGAGVKWQSLNQQLSASFRGTVANEAAVVAIPGIPGLRRIADLRLDPWTQGAWDTVAGIDGLQRLEIAGPGITELDLSALSPKPTLSELRLATPGLTDAQFDQLSGLDGLRILRIQLKDSSATDSGLRAFAGSPQLSLIDLYDATVTGSFVAAYAGNRYLRELRVSGEAARAPGSPGWTREGSAALVSALPRLPMLALAQQGFDDSALEPLHELVALESLDLGGCPNITPEGIASLVAGRPLLKRLELAGTPASDAIASIVPTLPSLQYLAIESVALTDRGLTEIARSRCLRELALRANLNREAGPAFTGEGITALATMPRLERLDIDVDFVLEGDVATLADSPALRDLTLRAESLTPEALDAITRIPSLERLTVRTGDEALFERWHAIAVEANPLLEVRN